MWEDHFHGDRVSEHPAVLCHPEGGLSPGGHWTHVSLPYVVHDVPDGGGLSLDPEFQMLPKTHNTWRG